MVKLFFQNLFLLMVSSGVALLLAEGILRLTANNIITLSVPDREVGQVERKNIHAVRFIPEAEKNIHIDTNSFGYRDGEWDFGGEEKKIMVLGDSFVDAMQVEKENRFTEILQKKFEDGGTHVRVFNFGKSGSGPESYLLVLKKWFPIIKPDLVIVSIFNGNDFENINYDLTSASGRVNYIVRDSNVQKYADIATQKEKINWEVRYYLGQSYVAQILNDALVKWKNRKVFSPETIAIPLYCDTESKVAKDSYVIMEYLIKNIKEVAGEHMLLMVIPEKNQEKLSFPHCDKERSETFFAQMGKELHFPVIPFLSEFLPETAPFYYPGHLNEEGHKKVADVLYKKLFPLFNTN